MPKAATGSEPAAVNPVPAKNSITSLKRYQACHQCRKRKLKCDAKRPCCSTCVRSHAYAVSHAVEGAVLPEHPECTYDEVPVFDAESGSSVSRKLYEKLEIKISELEAQLRERDREVQALRDGKASDDRSFATSPKVDDPVGGTPSIGTAENGPYNGFASQSPDDGRSRSFSYSGMNCETATPPLLSAGLSTAFDSFGVGLRSWPPNLPPQETTRHLVEAFFTYHIHATRLFHVSTFMASLELLPTDPRFPSTAVLHAMCAVGSLYSAAVPTSRTFQSTFEAPYELHQARWKKGHPRPDFHGIEEEEIPETFTEQQARFAKQVIDVGLIRGDFQCLQAQIMLTWWYLSQGRWTDAFLSAAHAIRCTAPCSLSTCYTTAAITHYKPPSVLPPAKSVVEDEVRRNTFWIAYAMERQQGTGNAWALSLDDQDVCQLLPLRGDQFERGILVLPEERQWSYAPDILYTHPENQTDSFILYVKSAILLSRVKTYNLRSTGTYYITRSKLSSDEFDPRRSSEFQELDQIVTGFRQSFSTLYKSPTGGDVFDPYLYTACISAVLAQILLHEPYAKPSDINCISARKTLAGSRAIVDLMHTVTATNYDVTLLDLQPLMCWFMAGRVLVRFLRAALDASRQDQILSIRSQVSFVRTVLSKAGERVPLAYRYSKMLNDTLINMVGEEFADPIPQSLPPRGSYDRNIPGADMHVGVPIIEQLLAQRE